MGEVYRARDTTLDRDVAVKILPAMFATDPDRVARFTREPKALASLNHPHIAQIHGFQQSAGITALVMELVEGPTLAERLAEQAKGKTAEKRADIWAFGVVLYEMLGGKRPFGGSDVSEMLAQILTMEPDWSALPAGAPSRIRDLLRRCLTKDARQRLHDIADATLDLNDPITPRPESELNASVADSRIRDWRELSAVSLALLAGVLRIFPVGCHSGQSRRLAHHKSMPRFTP